jgi:hypothetical protein
MDIEIYLLLISLKLKSLWVSKSALKKRREDQIEALHLLFGPLFFSEPSLISSLPYD